MDRRIRELERRAAIGDIHAQNTLIQHWGRAGLVPTDEHIKLMQPCGFVIGGDRAIREAMKIWCRLLRNLSDIVHLENIRGLGGIQNPVYLAEQKSIKRDIDSDIGRAEVAIFPSAFYDVFSHNVYPYIDMALDNMDYPPLFLHYNEVTNSLLTGFSCPTLEALVTKIYLVIRQAGKRDSLGNTPYQVTISWNLGDTALTPKIIGGYAGLALLDGRARLALPAEVSVTELFSDLPKLLQTQPGIWDEWGWGVCNNQEREYGRWDYHPIAQELGSMHWLFGAWS